MIKWQPFFFRGSSHDASLRFSPLKRLSYQNPDLRFVAQVHALPEPGVRHGMQDIGAKSVPDLIDTASEWLEGGA